MSDKLLTQQETRLALGKIGRTKLWELTRDGELQSVNIGRRRLYPESQIEAYIRRLTEAPAD